MVKDKQLVYSDGSVGLAWLDETADKKEWSQFRSFFVVSNMEQRSKIFSGQFDVFKLKRFFKVIGLGKHEE